MTNKTCPQNRWVPVNDGESAVGFLKNPESGEVWPALFPGYSVFGDPHFYLYGSIADRDAEIDEDHGLSTDKRVLTESDLWWEGDKVPEEWDEVVLYLPDSDPTERTAQNIHEFTSNDFVACTVEGGRLVVKNTDARFDYWGIGAPRYPVQIDQELRPYIRVKRADVDGIHRYWREKGLLP